VAITFAEVSDLLTGLAWPLLAAVVLWRLLPNIRSVIASRAFTVKAGGIEISVQQASEQIARQVDDLRTQVSALKAAPGVEGATVLEAASPIAEGVPRLRTVLWVDDFPENNAFEVASLEEKGVAVLQERTTAAATREIAARDDVDALISDMGRTEDGVTHPDAGLELLRALREQGVATPVLIYASAPAVNRTREAALAAGAAGITASATELMEQLGRLGMR